MHKQRQMCQDQGQSVKNNKAQKRALPHHNRKLNIVEKDLLPGHCHKQEK